MGSTDPIFIIGTERSGSNLLRVILTSHSRIDVPHPPHVMKYFGPLEHRYGFLGIEANLRRLATDVVRLVEMHIHPWERKVDLERLVAEADPPDLLGILIGLQQQHMEWNAKARWGNKSTFMVDHVDRVLARFPGARFIWLVRDPRDVAVSSRVSVFSPFHPYFTAKLWRDQQEQCLALERRLGPERVFRLHYEALIADPEGAVRQVCTFVDEAFEPAMLRYHETGAAKKGAELSESWQNTAAPVLQDNSGKWRGTLADADLRIVEGVCAAPMVDLGYGRASTGGWIEPDAGTRLWWWLSNQRDRLKVEWRSMRRDKNHWRRWGRAVLMRALRFLTRRRA